MFSGNETSLRLLLLLSNALLWCLFKQSHIIQQTAWSYFKPFLSGRCQCQGRWRLFFPFPVARPLSLPVSQYPVIKWLLVHVTRSLPHKSSSRFNGNKSSRPAGRGETYVADFKVSWKEGRKKHHGSNESTSNTADNITCCSVRIARGHGQIRCTRDCLWYVFYSQLYLDFYYNWP